MSNLPWPGSEAVLAFIALALMGVMGIMLIFHAVPDSNQQLVTFILGALAGAVTMAGGKKIADKVMGNATATAGAVE